MLNFFVMAMIALPVFDSEVEEILFRKNYSGSYPVENVNVLFIEKVIPGPVFDGKSYEDLHRTNLRNSKEDREKEIRKLLLTHTRIRRLLIDSRNEQTWMRIDSALIPDEHVHPLCQDTLRHLP